MRNYEKQAKVALVLYLKRGQKALCLLEQDQFSRAEEILRLRKAAFHNFRVADALCANSRFSAEQANEGWLSIWAKIQEIDEKLMSLIERKKTESELQVHRIRKQKVRINKFRSTHSYNSSFEKTI